MTPKKYLTTMGLCMLLSYIALSVYVGLWPENFQSADFCIFRSQKNYCQAAAQEELHTLVIGDSRAQAGLIPRSFDKACQSIAVPGGTPIEGYLLYKEYLKFNKAPQQVILSFAPTHYQDPATFWQRTLKYGGFNYSDLSEVAKQAKISNDKSFDDPDYHPAQVMWYSLASPSLYYSELFNTALFSRRKANNQLMATVKENRGYVKYGVVDPGLIPKEGQMKEFSSSPVLEEYLYRLLDLVKKSGSKLIIKNMPMNPVALNALATNYRSSFSDSLFQIAKKYPEAQVDPYLFSLPIRYFVDSSHLNEFGAKLLSDFWAACRKKQSLSDFSLGHLENELRKLSASHNGQKISQKKHAELNADLAAHISSMVSMNNKMEDVVLARSICTQLEEKHLKGSSFKKSDIHKCVARAFWLLEDTTQKNIVDALAAE